MNYFRNVNLAEFWEDSDYARREYVLPYPTDATVKNVQGKLGYMLPRAYIDLMRLQNGGLPTKSAFPTKTRTSWANDHIAVHGIMGIGDTGRYSLCGEAGSRFWIREWGYPPIGIYFGDCPSAGHDLICLDYRVCGPAGEPKVAHVDQEYDYRITHLADNFEQFITGLVNSAQFDEAEDENTVEFTWRTDAINAYIRRDDRDFGIGQYLNLEQRIEKGGVGWSNIKLNIPEAWVVKSVLVRDGLIILNTDASGTYYLSRENVGPLNFELLDGGGNLSDSELQVIWMKRAAAGV